MEGSHNPEKDNLPIPVFLQVEAVGDQSSIRSAFEQDLQRWFLEYFGC